LAEQERLQAVLGLRTDPDRILAGADQVVQRLVVNVHPPNMLRRPMTSLLVWSPAPGLVLSA